MLHKRITLCSPYVHNVVLGRTLILSDRHIMVFGPSESREGSIGAKITVRQGPSFLPSDTKRLLSINYGYILNNKRLKKQAEKQKIVICFFPPMPKTICLDSCSLFRCWHRLNKYLHIAPMYPFIRKSISVYSRVKCCSPPLITIMGWYVFVCCIEIH